MEFETAYTSCYVTTDPGNQKQTLKV